MEIITKEKRIEEIGEMMYKMRHILYAKTIPKSYIKLDMEEGTKSDFSVKEVKGLFKTMSKKDFAGLSIGAFRFEKTKKGDIKIIPNFSFTIKIKN